MRPFNTIHPPVVMPIDMRPIRVIQVISGLRAVDGGPSYSVPRLNIALRRADIESLVFTDFGPDETPAQDRQAIEVFNRQFTAIPGLRKLHLSMPMAQKLRDPADRFDMIHSHGLWRMPNLYAAQAARKRGIPIVVSPRGMLSATALKISPNMKRVFWLLGQESALRDTACFHATSHSEYDDIRRLGLNAPIAIIPNGVDLPDADMVVPGERRRPDKSQRTALFLGRIHPIKGVDTLVEAWAQVAEAFPNWKLRIVGPGEPMHLASIKDLIRRSGVPQLTMEDGIDGAEKFKAFADADLFVQPSYSENFGLTVAESLVCGTPVVVTKGAPWQGVETYGCGWWIDTGVPAMVAGLRTALTTPRDELDAMGRRGNRWVRQAFSWDAIGEEMAKVYRWLLGRGDLPACVERDKD